MHFPNIVPTFAAHRIGGNMRMTPERNAKGEARVSCHGSREVTLKSSREPIFLNQGRNFYLT